MNNWNIPDWLEKEVRGRDKTCIYCRITMLKSAPSTGPRKSVATWEHIINDETIVTRENIALCCTSCNSGKGAKRLADWLESSYCKKHGIDKYSVADIAKNTLI